MPVTLRATMRESMVSKLDTLEFEHYRSIEHYARVERTRKPDESFLDALVRLAIIDFISDCAGSQKDAAHWLHCSPRVVCYHAKASGHNSYLGREKRLEIAKKKRLAKENAQ